MYNKAMTKEQIFQALNPSWWIVQPNLWQTDYLSTQILFNTLGGEQVYTSSAPYIVVTGEGGATTTPTDMTHTLRVAAAQRLYDMHCTSVTGNQALAYVYGAQS